MNDIEQLKNGKEIKDIISERDRIQHLINESKWDELDSYLQSLRFKYSVETLFYNIVNSIQPSNTYENAQNCMKF